jgi:hypothetical protein
MGRHRQRHRRWLVIAVGGVPAGSIDVAIAQRGQRIAIPVVARSWLADLERLPSSGRSLAGPDREQFDVVDRRIKRGLKSVRVSMRLREEIPALRSSEQ